MSKHNRDYVLAVQAAACRLDDASFATESAFALHLKALWSDLSPDFDRLVVVAPEFDKLAFDGNPAAYGVISEKQDGIVLVTAYKIGTSPFEFWRRDALPLWRRLGEVFSTAGYVQSGLASNIWIPYLFLVNTRALLNKTPSTFIIDIDFRKMSHRYFRSGVWSRKSYIVNRVLHDTFKQAQVWLAVKTSKLVLLKSPSMTAAYGGGKPHVKDFLDAAHGTGDVVSDEDLRARLAQRTALQRPLEVSYFGRFATYKGLDLTLDAVEIAIARGADIRLTLIGGGECLEDLRTRAKSEGLKGAVRFLPFVPYGQALFALVDQTDLTIASPKGEDTPRAALDSMARGVPVLAFDIDYFRNLSEKSGAVVLAQWPSAESLAGQLVALAQDRSRISGMAWKAAAFARANTQDIWLEKRFRWTKEAYTKRS